jgi:hypothetical protein
MATIARKHCTNLLVVQLYRRELTSLKLRTSSQKGYVSQASGWTYAVANGAGIGQVLIEQEEVCMYYASQERWGRLQAIRNEAITARLLTLTKLEICDYISAWSREKNISGIATGLNAIDRFYRWLERERFVKTNHFQLVRSQLSYTVSGFTTSLDKAREN